MKPLVGNTDDNTDDNTDTEFLIASSAVAALIKKKLFSEEVKKVFDDVITQDINLPSAIVLLNSSNILTKETLDAVMLSHKKGGDPSATAFAISEEIKNGFENLKKLEKHGMNTTENRKAVVNAGEKAVETSLALWEQQKKKIIAGVHERSTGHPLAMAYASASARTVMDEKTKELEAVTKSLHQSTALKTKTSQSRK